MNYDQKDFLSRPLDPLSYYNILPSDPTLIRPGHTEKSALEIRDILLKSVASDVLIPLLDDLSIRLINDFDSLAGDQNWKPLADQMAQWYADALLPDGSKKFRMRVQLLNFFLRDILDAFKPKDFLQSETLAAVCPCDFLKLPNEEIWLTSEEFNVVRNRSDGSVEKLNCGLPTRMDVLPDGRIGVHSLYSAGGWLLNESGADFVEHDAPIILFFTRNDKLCFIDFQTRIFHAKTLELLAGPVLERTHFARLVGDRIFLIDCCQTGTIFELDRQKLHLNSFNINPVLICNDLCCIDDTFYLIDKEQGSVFSFDRQFNYIGRRLSFGRAPGRLWDPAAIRVVNGQLQVLNWFTNSLVSVDPF